MPWFVFQELHQLLLYHISSSYEMRHLLLVFLVDCLLLHAAAQIIKRRLCVMFEVNKYRKSSGVLSSLNVVDKNHCMMECTRHGSCHAINYALDTGLCELVTRVTGCMAVTESPRFHFVHMGECDAVIPWRALTPVDGNWQWVIETNLIDWSKAIDLSGIRYVSRTFYKGTYLPGWWQSGLFRTITPQIETSFCRNPSGQLLVMDPLNYNWTAFTSGEAVPANALIGGYWPDDAPLYIIRAIILGEFHSGYYNARITKAFIIKNNPEHPVNMDILVYLWTRKEYAISYILCLWDMHWTKSPYTWTNIFIPFFIYVG